MKQILFSLVVAVTFNVSAQTGSIPEGYVNGYFISNSNEKSEGFIKETFKKGGILFITNSGNKKAYTPADINEFTIGTTVYIAYLNDFYKVASGGIKSTLLQKVTNNSGKMLYNGTEAYAAATTEGKPGDYYLGIKTTNQFELITKDNFEKVFTTSCADCTALVTNIRGKQLDYYSIEKAVEQYNNCN